MEVVLLCLRVVRRLLGLVEVLMRIRSDCSEMGGARLSFR